MRIINVKVKGYRCLADIDLDFNDFTAFIGSNGTGKSSVLYTLNWFFNGGTVKVDDLHCANGSSSKSQEASVEVAFGDLNDQDRVVLERYGHGATARFRRSWSSETEEEKIIGNAMQGPGFSKVRASTRVADMRHLYNVLRERFPKLRAVQTRDEIIQELVSWEDRPENAELLEEVPNDDATHMFGIAGGHALAQRIRMVLIPAAADIADEVGAAGRGSALAALVGNLMKEAVASARAAWEVRYAQEIQQLEESIKTGVVAATKVQATRVNTLLRNMVPSAEVEFSAASPTWNLRDDGSLNTDVIIDGTRRDVTRQGHGVQRAVMMAMLEALVPDETLAREQHAVQEGETSEEAEARLTATLQALPALVIGIEEPEIYQHPVRARSFARVLQALSRREGTQVFIATHSPYLVLPEQFGSLKHFSLSGGCSVVSSTTVASVASSTGLADASITRAVERELPRTFSEGFFADAVVFVEGETDRVILEVVAERIGQPLDSRGIAVLAMGGKGNFRVPFEILRGLDIPVYVIADSDSKSAAGNPGNDPKRLQDVEASHERATAQLLSWLPSSISVGIGTMPFVYGSPTLVARDYSIFEDAIEAELDRWPSFVSELATLGDHLRSKNVAAYRSAAMSARLDDLPSTFSAIVSAISAFAC